MSFKLKNTQVCSGHATHRLLEAPALSCTLLRTPRFLANPGPSIWLNNSYHLASRQSQLILVESHPEADSSMLKDREFLAKSHKSLR